MGNLFNVCASARAIPTERKSVEKRRFEVQPETELPPTITEDEKPILKAMIGPIGGRGPLNAEQEAGRRRFGM